jgi:hypothetical protein
VDLFSCLLAQVLPAVTSSCLRARALVSTVAAVLFACSLALVRALVALFTSAVVMVLVPLRLVVCAWLRARPLHRCLVALSWPLVTVPLQATSRLVSAAAVVPAVATLLFPRVRPRAVAVTSLWQAATATPLLVAVRR